MKRLILVILLGIVLSLGSCNKQKELLIVTTTSLDGSGFLNFILPYFEDEYDVFVKVVAVGTGAALELGEMGEADILLVHDYDNEMIFMENGFSEKRSNLMYNDFLFVGPFDIPSDTLEETLEEISTNYSFYSRGDLSGTHMKELSIWEKYGYDVSTFGDWYKETGQSMGATLTMASQSGFFTLVDRATYCFMVDSIDLVPVYENPEELLNQYGVIKVNPDLYDGSDELAELFYNWIIRSDIQELIATYKVNDLQLFFPNAGSYK